MLNRNNFEVEKYASRETSEYSLHAILVQPDATVATDGHTLIWMSVPEFEPGNFPSIDGFGEATNKYHTFMLNGDTAKRIADSLPRPGTQTIPITETAAVSEDGDKRAIAVTDLENPQIFPVGKVEGTFPNYGPVIPDPKKIKLRIAINPKYLQRIAETAIRLQRNSVPMVIISFQDEQSALRFDAVSSQEQSMTALIMPMKFDKDYYLKHGYKHPEKIAVAKKAQPEAEQKQLSDTILEPGTTTPAPAKRKVPVGKKGGKTTKRKTRK